MTPNQPLAGLLGEDLVRESLADVRAGRCTVPSCPVAIALPRLRRTGLILDVMPGLQMDAELQLSRLLRHAGGDACSRYNSLLRELIGFEQALDRRTQQVTEDAEI